jgi:hypothetical protein
MKSSKSLVLCALAAQFGLTGCARTPLVNILGSYFPVWMFCLAGGVLLTVAARHVLILARLEKELGPRALVYPSLTGLFACAIWLFAFHD